MSSAADFSSVAIAVTTVIYTLGTFLLWKTIHATLRLARDRASRGQQRVQAALVSSLVGHHRELFAMILQDRDLLSSFVADSDLGQDTVRDELLGSFLLNHALQVYYHWRHGTLDEELWVVLQADMDDLLAVPVVKRAWARARETFPPGFRDFVENSRLGAAATDRLAEVECNDSIESSESAQREGGKDEARTNRRI